MKLVGKVKPPVSNMETGGFAVSGAGLSPPIWDEPGYFWYLPSTSRPWPLWATVSGDFLAWVWRCVRSDEVHKVHRPDLSVAG